MSIKTCKECGTSYDKSAREHCACVCGCCGCGRDGEGNCPYYCMEDLDENDICRDCGCKPSDRIIQRHKALKRLQEGGKNG